MICCPEISGKIDTILLCLKLWLQQITMNEINLVGDNIFKVTEWDWLKIQLELESIKSRGNYVSKHYRFDDENR